MRATGALFFVTVACLWAAEARAQTTAEAAAAAQKAHAAGDAQALAALAGGAEPDPWLVVEHLFGEDQGDVAAALAAASESKALIDYATWRRANPVDPVRAEALRKVVARRTVTDEWLAGIEPMLENARGVTAVRLLAFHARGLRAAKRPPDALATAYERAIDAATAIGWHAHALRIAADAWYTTRKLGDLPAEARTIRAYLAVAQALDDRAERTRGHIGLARALRLTHQYEASLRHARAAIPLARTPTEHRDALRAAIMIEVQTGRAHAAIRHVLALRKKDRALDSPDAFHASEVQLASLEATLGKSTSALARIARALQYFEKKGSPGHLRGVHLNAANVSISLLNLDRAMFHIRKAHEAGKGLGYNDAALLMLEATALRLQRRIPEARAVLQRAFPLLEKLSKASRLGAHLNMAMLCSMMQQPTQAAEHIAKARALDSGKVPAIRARIHAAAAFVHLGARQYDEAIREGEQGRKLCEEFLLYEIRHSCELRLATAWRRKGNAARAAQHADAAMHILLQRSASLPARVGAHFRVETRETFQTAVDLAVELGDDARLFACAEKVAAVALRTRLGSTDTLQALEPGLVQRAAELQEAEWEAVATYRATVADKDPAATKKAFAQLGAVRERLDRHRERMRAHHAAAAQVLAPTIDDLATAQKRLDSGTGILMFARGMKSLYVLRITRDDVSRVRLPNPDVEALLAETALDDPTAPWQPGVQRLRKALVGEVPLPPSLRHLLVVPTGAVATVPFAALWPEREVTVLPSLATGRLLAERRATGQGAMVLADPESADGRRLPGARKEAEAFGDVTLVGKDATEARLQAALASRPRWRAVHLACHGLIDPMHPLRSALSLTPTQKDDGLWTVSEILEAKVPTDLAVLGSCSTGRGKTFDQEGTLGFVHAFFVAGATRVIVSLWDVDDTATSALLRKFHSVWKPGVAPATALQQAQAWVRSQPKWAHPSYWAAWQLWGPR